MKKQLLFYSKDNNFASKLISELELVIDYKISIASSISEIETITSTACQLLLIDLEDIDNNSELYSLVEEKEIPTVFISNIHEHSNANSFFIKSIYKKDRDSNEDIIFEVQKIIRNRDVKIDIIGEESNEKNLAKRILQENHFNLLNSSMVDETILDLIVIVANKENEFELINSIREKNSRNRVGILVILPENNLEKKDEFLKEDINELLLGDFSKEEFIFRIDNVLDNLNLFKSSNTITRELDNYKTIVDKNVIISKTDTKGFITYVSSAFCQISEYSEDELIGKPHNIVRHSDMPSSAFEDLWSTVKSGKVWQGEVKNRKKYGGYYWVEATVKPELNNDGEIIGFISVRQDITTAKQLEDIYVHQIAEQNQARNKQIKSIVNEFEESDVFESKVLYHASDILSGDIYSLRKFDDGSALIYILDAMGHGLLPSFTTFAATSTIKRFLDTSSSLKELVTHLSSSLRTILDEEEQLSYTFVHISSDFKTIEYASGGMYPAVLSTSSGVKQLRANNAPFMQFMPDIKVNTIKDEEFEKVLIYSDGLVEDEGSGITKDNIEDALDEETLDSVMLFLEINDLEDDTTIIYFKRKDLV